ncbi:MAG: hypothetical protein ACTSU5_16560 [Promethearchaeota archaeon]
MDNLPLLLLASGSVLKDTIRLLASQPKPLPPLVQKYINLSYIIHYKEVGKMTEIKEILPRDIESNIREAIHHLGIKEVVDAVGLKEVIDAVGTEAVLRVLDPAEVERFIEAKKKRK